MFKRISATIIAAVLLGGCGLLPSVPGSSDASSEPGPTPAASAQIGTAPDVEAFEQAITDLQAAAGVDAFWELTFSSRSRVTMVAADGLKGVEYTWSGPGEVEERGPARVTGIVPVMFADVDLPAIMAAAEQSYLTYYDCTTYIESVGYQGQIKVLCDDEFEHFWALDLTPMHADFSSEQAMADSLALIARGAPELITDFTMSGPADPRLSVTFLERSGRSGIHLSDQQGMRSLGDSAGTPVAYSSLDAAWLYPCAQKMMAASGLSGWHVWMYVQPDGSIQLHWDISGFWDPHDTVNVTNERCEVIAP